MDDSICNSKYLGAKHCRTHLNSGQASFDIEVDTPNLSDARFSVWGDWGPMFTFRLTRGQSFDITYRCTKTGRTRNVRVFAPTVELNSPMRASQREASPFVLEFLDVARALRFRAFLDQEGQVARLVVNPMHSGCELDSLVFPEEASDAEAEVAVAS